MEALLDGEAEALTRKAIDKALEGDTAALRLCLERIAPVRKDRHVTFPLQPINTAADAVTAAASLVAAVASGDLTPSEASELGKLIDSVVRSLEASEFASRLEKLERVINQ